MATITSTFVGRHPITWEPGIPPTTNYPSPTADQRQEFNDFLQEEFEACKNKKGLYKNKDFKWQMDRQNHILVIRALLLDPSTTFPAWLPKANFTVLFGMILLPVQCILASWCRKPILDEVIDQDGISVDPRGILQDVKNQVKSGGTRPAEDKVPKWYDWKCALTGVPGVAAAHIIDVQATKGMGSSQYTIWQYLESLFPCRPSPSFEVTGNETQNILPIEPTAHYLWDTNKFGLRPILHPSGHPADGIYLQVVWFEEYHDSIGWDTSGGRSYNESLHNNRRTVVDSAKNKSVKFASHGDVIQLRSADLASYPLPDHRFLQHRYGVQKLLAAMSAAGALRQIFDQDPPPVNPVPSGTRGDISSYMPRDWDWMIGEAYKLGILDDTSEGLWRNCILECSYKEYSDAMQARKEQQEEEPVELEEEGELGESECGGEEEEC
ncbi:hypothetical protein QBC39DRAFT_103971 [Podospora conica]|nr:hypothetical protein QBC39DRAFT_103971 [Schizothecium conicum]